MTDDYWVLTKDGRSKFIFDTWIYTAGYAYSQYMTHGRGVLVISGTLSGGPDHPTYAPNIESDNPEFDNQVNEAIKTYNPEDEIVVMFDLPGLTAFGTYGVDNTPPPEAYKLFQNEQGKTQRVTDD